MTERGRDGDKVVRPYEVREEIWASSRTVVFLVERGGGVDY